jgi:hypothetical protein
MNISSGLQRISLDCLLGTIEHQPLSPLDFSLQASVTHNTVLRYKVAYAKFSTLEQRREAGCPNKSACVL